MNEQGIQDKIKIGVKSPSFEFSDKVMGEISSIQNEVPCESKWTFRILLIACYLLFILSIFVRLSEIKFFKYSIKFSPVIMPIISLIFIFIVLQQLYDIRNRIIDIRNNNVLQSTE